MNYFRNGIFTGDLEQYQFNESIFFTGNGYMGARAYISEEQGLAKVDRGTMIAGVFDNITEQITDVVNHTDLFEFILKVNHRIISPLHMDIQKFKQTLDYRTGLMSYSYEVCLEEGVFQVKVSRFFNYRNLHHSAMKVEVMPVNFDAIIEVINILDGHSENRPINDDQVKENNDIVSYITVKKAEVLPEYLYVLNQTKKTNIDISIASQCTYGDTIKPIKKEKFIEETKACECIEFKAERGRHYSFTRNNILYTSRDLEKEQLKMACETDLADVKEYDFNMLLKQTEDVLEGIWKDCDILLEGDERVQSALRYNIYQLICNNAREDQRVSIGARGLTHARYKGCYFWDTDIFLLPFYVYTAPQAARKLLEYRYGALDAARKHALKMNCKGARYPWMASYDGSEQCESWDIGACEMHITADIAYAFDHYIRITGDEGMLYDMACEVYIETARFWADRFTYDEKADRYNMLFVKGPDEYCGATTNNTFTNFMAMYNMKLAIAALEKMKLDCPAQLEKLLDRIQFKQEEIEHWLEICNKIPLNYDATRKLYIQDDTFEKLEPLDINAFKSGEEALYHKICFDRLQRYKVLKQADLILLMAMFPNDFTQEEKEAAFHYYEPLTLHDSSLSYGTHAQMAALLGKEELALAYFEKSLFLDLENIMNNTGKEGIHVASLGASWQAMILGFAGVSFENGELKVAPKMPKHWKKCSFSLYVHGFKHLITIDETGVNIHKYPKKEIV